MIVYQHKALAEGRWRTFSFAEQMAHVGGEVERAMNWRTKGHAESSRLAAERALELMDLTLESTKGYPRLKEVARAREALVDDFFGRNEYRSTDEAWRRYFGAFTWLARKGH